jgi:hypothetical protein
MEKMIELVDAWMKSQKEFMETWMKSQKDFMENWMAATKKLQDAFLMAGVPQDSPMKETLDRYKAWFSTMEQSSKSFVDETGKVHELWKNAAEKQMDMSRQMIKNYAELFNTASKKQPQP